MQREAGSMDLQKEIQVIISEQAKVLPDEPEAMIHVSIQRAYIPKKHRDQVSDDDCPCNRRSRFVIQRSFYDEEGRVHHLHLGCFFGWPRSKEARATAATFCDLFHAGLGITEHDPILPEFLRPRVLQCSEQLQGRLKDSSQVLLQLRALLKQMTKRLKHEVAPKVACTCNQRLVEQQAGTGPKPPKRKRVIGGSARSLAGAQLWVPQGWAPGQAQGGVLQLVGWQGQGEATTVLQARPAGAGAGPLPLNWKAEQEHTVWADPSRLVTAVAPLQDIDKAAGGTHLEPGTGASLELQGAPLLLLRHCKRVQTKEGEHPGAAAAAGASTGGGVSIGEGSGGCASMLPEAGEVQAQSLSASVAVPGAGPKELQGPPSVPAPLKTASNQCVRVADSTGPVGKVVQVSGGLVGAESMGPLEEVLQARPVAGADEDSETPMSKRMKAATEPEWARQYMVLLQKQQAPVHANSEESKHAQGTPGAKWRQERTQVVPGEGPEAGSIALPTPAGKAGQATIPDAAAEAPAGGKGSTEGIEDQDCVEGMAHSSMAILISENNSRPSEAVEEGTGQDGGMEARSSIMEGDMEGDVDVDGEEPRPEDAQTVQQEQEQQLEQHKFHLGQEQQQQLAQEVVGKGHKSADVTRALNAEAVRGSGPQTPVDTEHVLSLPRGHALVLVPSEHEHFGQDVEQPLVLRHPDEPRNQLQTQGDSRLQPGMENAHLRVLDPYEREILYQQLQAQHQLQQHPQLQEEEPQLEQQEQQEPQLEQQEPQLEKQELQVEQQEPQQQQQEPQLEQQQQQQQQQQQKLPAGQKLLDFFHWKQNPRVLQRKRQRQRGSSGAADGLSDDTGVRRTRTKRQVVGENQERRLQNSEWAGQSRAAEASGQVSGAGATSRRVQLRELMQMQLQQPPLEHVQPLSMPVPVPLSSMQNEGAEIEIC